MKRLIVITGPTAVGKTNLCMDIAGQLGIPIINADSRQLFRQLPIGTAQPTKEQRARVQHYFVGTLDIGDYYSASMYEQDVMSLLQQLFAGSDYALLSGGSMMYIDAVCNGIDDIPTVRDDIREEMKRRYEEEGLEALCEELKRLDRPAFLVGDGAALTADYLAAAGLPHRLAPENLRWQSAWGVAMAAQDKTPGTADELLPVYLRLSQAERERQERLKREGEA